MAVKTSRRQNKLLTAVTLPQLSDGYVGRIIDKACETVYRDIEQRGVKDLLARKITIEIEFKPGQNGHVAIDSQVKTKLPAYRPEPTIAKISEEEQGLLFAPDCAENPDQLTILPADEERAAAGD